ncbi:pyruvate carboxyltransferase [Streptomyces cinnamoneus]|nr:pyruvate carboxyltransferase [Streptomyces cinnamoneus]
MDSVDFQNVRLLDVTLRDGGYVNRHSWAADQAERVVRSVVRAGVERVEVGYFRPRRHDADGATAPTASCPSGFLARLRRAAPRARLAVMVRPGDTAPEDYAALPALGVTTVRFPVGPRNLAATRPHIEAVKAAGMAVGLNVIRVSELPPAEVVRIAERAEGDGADVFYLADSNGSLFPEDVARLVGEIRGHLAIPLGFHAHDGLHLAFGNALAALREGCAYLDASLGGMGKGGGNLRLDLIAGYLRSRGVRSLDIAPLARAAADVLEPWKTRDFTAEAESIVSGLLNLNLDEISAARERNDGRDLVSLLNR